MNHLVLLDGPVLKYSGCCCRCRWFGGGLHNFDTAREIMMVNNSCIGVALGSFGSTSLRGAISRSISSCIYFSDWIDWVVPYIIYSTLYSRTELFHLFLGVGNIANYNFWSGYTQHIYMGGNSIQHVWGSDREVMTTDPCAGAYVHRQ